LAPAAFALAPSAGAQTTTEFIDATGDGAGIALDQPVGIAVDGSKNSYVCGAESNNVLRITPSGVVTEILNSSDGLFRPWGVAADASGNVFITSNLNDTIFKVTPAGKISIILDASGDGAGNTLDGPAYICVDDMGNVYVTGQISNNAFRIAANGVVRQIIDASGDGSGNNKLTKAQGVAVDKVGNVYIAGLDSNNVFQVSSIGVVTEVLNSTGNGASKVDSPYAVAVDATGDLFVACFDSNNVFKVTQPAGANTITQILDSSGDGGGNNLNNPVGIAVDGVGNAFVSGYSSHNLFMIESGGGVTEIIDASGDGGGNSMQRPHQLALDNAGGVYVSCAESNNAFMVQPGHAIGSNYCGPAKFNSTGQSAVISAFGSTGASANLLTLTASQLPPNVFGYFLNSDTQGSTLFPPGSSGKPCLGGGIGDHAKLKANSGPAGKLVISVDLTALPRPGGGTHSVLAGETWNFQCWFRDNQGGPTSNFTDGIEIVFN